MTLIFTSKDVESTAPDLRYVKTDFSAPGLLFNMMNNLLQKNIQSVIIEGGAVTLSEFINAGLWDEARIFTAPVSWGKGIKAPVPGEYGSIVSFKQIGSDTLTIYKNIRA